MNKIRSSIVFCLIMICFFFQTFAQTADLTLHQPSIVPSNATFEWHISQNPSSSIVANPNSVGAGIYYAFYNYGGGCYSQPTPIKVIANSCPDNTVNLFNSVGNTNLPSGNILTFHSSLPATTSNKLSGSSVTSATNGTYYASYFDFAKNLYSPGSPIIVINSPCCVASTLPTATTSPTNLSNHQPSQIPAGATLEWHISDNSNSGLVSNPNAVNDGIYYAFYNYGNGCFSTGSPLRVISNTCQSLSVDLNSSVNTISKPAWATITYHSALPVSTINKLSNSVVSASGTYYIAFFDAANNCYSNANPVVVKINPCCPTITNLASNNLNPSSCGENDGRIKICGLVPNKSGYNLTYAVNGSTNVNLVNQVADECGCLSILNLTAGTYAVAVSHPIDCTGGSNTLTATLANPVTFLPPTITDALVCGSGQATLNAACYAGSPKWYDISTASQAISSGNTFISPNLTESKFYYVSCQVGSCESAKTPILAKIEAIPKTEIIALNPKCYGTTSRNDGEIWANKYLNSDSFSISNGLVYNQQSSSAVQLIPSNGILLNNISLNNLQTYTVRIISNKGCLKDTTFTMTNTCPNCPASYCISPTITFN